MRHEYVHQLFIAYAHPSQYHNMQLSGRHQNRASFHLHYIHPSPVSTCNRASVLVQPSVRLTSNLYRPDDTAIRSVPKRHALIATAKPGQFGLYRHVQGIRSGGGKIKKEKRKGGIRVRHFLWLW